MSRDRVFVDTGAWLALALSDDAHHAGAEKALRELVAAGTRLVTTNHVIGETYTFLARVRDARTALAFVAKTRASIVLDLIFVPEEIENRAFAWLEKYEDQKLSYTDAVSFAVMEELGLRKAFSFDRHFEAAGFARMPKAVQHELY